MSRPVSDAHAATWRARQVPVPAQVVDGVWAIPVPLHGSALRSITVFLIATGDGPVLVDAGYDHPSCWASFQQSVAAVGQRVDAITAVLLTHNHPDHVGFADRVRAASGARVIMGGADDFATMHRQRSTFLQQVRTALDLTGAPPDVVAAMYADAVAVAAHPESLRLDVPLTGETEFRFGDVTLRALPAPGHTYGHTVYVDTRGLVFTGDTMMAEGPTQLAIVSRPDDDPAADLFRTLARIRDLGAAIACPAHQFPYRDVAARAEALTAFHRDEVETVRGLAHDGSTAWDLARRMTWKKPWDALGRGTRRFALVHTLALLRHATATRRD
ncbi:Glyoxylase, beta-lactamase superfamily II [Micromonospora matsumotoense]|uniref:Glyoxylase, beta-lactamase superfamily II n=1 Tax=Micromonospora matsumotoense TaxID=121616 RepID=A0A1C4Z1C5_9ACTN|nr:MBL fold metallo-hydrolase [Micromonospora matsumotoense]SCF26391.1 Glyoxylase, beta-lactamase superfamily II [Micromonospora matsumotoense]